VRARFGPKLRELRRQAEITLESFAQQTGINIATLSLIEQGKKRPPELYPYVDNIARLCGLAEGSAEHQSFLELAQKERFARRRVFVSPMPRRLKKASVCPADSSSKLDQVAEILRALATALDRAGNRRVLRVMLRLEDGKKVVVAIAKQEAVPEDAG
jgi:transcriptional regulator with XRE-family HTH domain